MPRTRAPRRLIHKSRILRLEALELRAVPAALVDVAPLSLPLGFNQDYDVANNPEGGLRATSATQSAGSNGEGESSTASENAPLAGPLNIALPLPGGIGMGAASRLVDGTLRISQGGQTVFDLTPQGELAGSSTVKLQPEDNLGGVSAISPDGRWLGGSQSYSPYYNSAQPATWPQFGLWDAQNPDSFAPIDLSALPGSAQGQIYGISNSGVALVNINGGLGYRWDAEHGITRLTSLLELGGDASDSARRAYGAAISADGSVIVGHSGGWGDPSFATRWTAAGDPQPLPAIGGQSEARSMSLDGRVIGGVVYDPTQNTQDEGGLATAAVWVDDQLVQLHDEHGNPAEGFVQRVVNGVNGDPRQWIALGYSGGGAFIAFSDGVVRPLNDWLWQHDSIALTDTQAVVNAFVADDTLSLVTYDRRILLGSPVNLMDMGIHDFRPPLPPTANRLIVVSLSQDHPPEPLDLNRDRVVSPADVLLVINALNYQIANGIEGGPVPPSAFGVTLDVSGDGLLSPADALVIINRLNANLSANSAADTASTTVSEGESASATSDSDLSALAADEVFRELTAPRRR
jgi:hypothetical protein